MVLDAVVDCAYNVYQGYSNLSPSVRAMITAEVIYPAADITSQLIEKRTFDLRRVNWKKVGYKAALAPVYGLGIHALMESGDIAPSTLVAEPLDPIIGPNLRKAIFGCNFYAQLLNSFFFVNETVGDKKDHSITELVKHYRDLFKNEDRSPRRIRDYWTNFKEKYWNNFWGKEFKKTTALVLTVNNGVVAGIYYFVPKAMQTSATLGYVFLFTILMTSLASKNGNNTVERGLEEIT